MALAQYNSPQERDLNFIEEIKNQLMEEYYLKLDSPEWDLAMIKLNLLKNNDPDHFFYESPSYWAQILAG